MPGGRPTDYKPIYATQARKLCKLGATNQDLAEFFEVAVSTIYLWAVTHKEFSESLKIAKGEYDDRVERALAMSAIGYACPETKVHVVDGRIVKTDVIKHYPPHPGAAKIWLANRRPDKWANVSEENDDDTPVQFEIVVKDARRDNGNV
jgi:hypothetical protein